MKTDLRNKSVLITGASSGIGAATAKEFAKEGSTVSLVARNGEKLKKLAEEISQSGGKTEYFIADVSDFSAVQQLAKRVKSEIGIPDILTD